MKLNKIKALHKDLDRFKYKCKKKCFECCTAISFLPEEEKLMKKELLKNGYKKPPNGKGKKYCEYLTKEGKCSVYKSRPVVCRSFSDISFQLRNGERKFLTQICTYSKKRKVVIPSKEFLDYQKEVMIKGIVNDNCMDVVNSLENDNILINK